MMISSLSTDFHKFSATSIITSLTTRPFFSPCQVNSTPTSRCNSSPSSLPWLLQPSRLPTLSRGRTPAASALARIVSPFPTAATTKQALEANVCGPAVPARVNALERGVNSGFGFGTSV